MVRKDSFEVLNLYAPVFPRTGLEVAKTEMAKSRGSIMHLTVTCVPDGRYIGIQSMTQVASFYAYVGVNIREDVRTSVISPSIAVSLQYGRLTFLKIELRA